MSSEFIAIVIVFALLLSITAGVLNLPYFKGKIGEKAIHDILLTLSDEYHVWKDIVIQNNGYSVQIDHLVISPYGIFVIETKNYRGGIYGDEDSQEWKQIIVTPVRYKSSFKTYTYVTKNFFYNPIKQNASHIRALAHLLHMPMNAFNSIVVFLNGAELKCNTTTPVIYSWQLYNVIKDHVWKVMSMDEVIRLASIVNMASIENENTRKEHVRKANAARVKYNSHINQGICPRCGGSLVERQGKYGTFLGCSNYPSCKFTLSHG